MTKLVRLAGTGMTVLALFVGAASPLGIETVSAQDATETAQDAEGATPGAQVETNAGFDDWGLLGLLGLIGLAGLMRRPDRTEAIDRTAPTRPIGSDRS